MNLGLEFHTVYIEKRLSLFNSLHGVSEEELYKVIINRCKDDVDIIEKENGLYFRFTDELHEKRVLRDLKTFMADWLYLKQTNMKVVKKGA